MGDAVIKVLAVSTGQRENVGYAKPYKFIGDEIRYLHLTLSAGMQ
jgi:hypothetical protein